jgi:Kef-type K+ transport system membrane component KefB
MDIMGSVLSHPLGGDGAHSRSLAGDIREPLSSTFTLFLLQVLVILVFSRLVSALCKLVKQPEVVGEMVAGILLGPTALGKIPGFQATLFPFSSLDTLTIVASFGLCFFMLSVGMEMDIPSVTRNWRSAFLLSFLGLAVPAAASFGLAVLFVAPAFSSASVGVLGLFLTCCLGIISLPVLARILKERQVDARLQELVLSVAVVEDIAAYILLAIVTVLVKPSVGSESIGIIVGATIGECLLVFIPLRSAVDAIVARSQALNKQLDAGTFLFLVVCLVVCCLLTNIIGLSFMIGAFQMGMIIPRTSGLAHQIAEKVEFFSTAVLMPIYFAVSGLKTDFSKIDSGESWGLAFLLITVALASKFLSVYAACRMVALPPLMSRVVSALMTCKGLIALVVINVGLDAKAITPKFFSILVLMVLVCTVGTVPLVNLMDALSTKEAAAEEMEAYGRTLEDRGRPEQGKLLSGGLAPAAAVGGDGSSSITNNLRPRRLGRPTRGMSLAGALAEELSHLRAPTLTLLAEEGGPEGAVAPQSAVVWASSPVFSGIARSASFEQRSRASSLGGGGGGGSGGATPAHAAGPAGGALMATPLVLPAAAPPPAADAPPLPGLSLLGSGPLGGVAEEEGSEAAAARPPAPVTPKQPPFSPPRAMGAPTPRFRVCAVFSDPVSVASLVAVGDLFAPLPEAGQLHHSGASLSVHWLQTNLDMPSALVAGVGLDVLDKERHDDMFDLLSSCAAARAVVPAEGGPAELPPPLSLETPASATLENAHVMLEVPPAASLTPVQEEGAIPAGEDEGDAGAAAAGSALPSAQQSPKQHAPLRSTFLAAGQNGSAFAFAAKLSSGPWQEAQVIAEKEAAHLLLVTSRFPVVSQGSLELTSVLIGQVMKDVKSAFSL